MKKTDRHFIGMAGLHGYLPSFCDVFESQEDASEALSQLHDLGIRRARRLKIDGYLELNLKRDGNEYCEIEECNCDDASIHTGYFEED